MSRLLSVCLLALTLSFLPGCGKDDSSPSSGLESSDASTSTASTSSTETQPGTGPEDATSTTDNAVADAASETVKTLSDPIAKAPSGPAWPDREGLTGNWLLNMFHVIPPQEQDSPPQIGERPVVLFHLEPGENDGDDSLEIVAAREEFDIGESVRGSLDDDLVSFECTKPDGDRAYLFEGRRADNGAVVGGIVFADGSFRPARLLPTNERTFIRIPTFAMLPEAAEMMRLRSSPVPDEDTRLFVEKYPTSPISEFAWKQLIQMVATKSGATDELTKLIDEYCEHQGKWSDRLRRVAIVETYIMLGTGSAFHDWCLARVDAVNAVIDEDPELASLKPQVKQVTLECRFRHTLELLISDDDEAKDRGVAQAMELLEERPHEPTLVLALADLARIRDEVDRAIELYAELVALPFQEQILQQRYSQSAVQKILPTERLSTLWKEKHGNTDGLAAYIQKSYDDNLLDFVTDTFEERPADSGTHTVLLELFTGARSPLCISPETVLAAMDRTYPSSMVVSLRYHLHVPEHDPLTNEDNEARFFNYYRAQGTPSLFLDGALVGGALGTIPDAPARYNDIRSMLVPQYSMETEVSIDLNATRQGDKIEASVNVNGADLTNDRLRLRIVLAENEVPFLAQIGIRSHSMVVRKMIGGDRGLAPADGKLGWQGTIDVSEVRDSLHTYLTHYEENFGINFSSMPLDLESLSLIAFVQDDTTHKILQTRLIPIAAGK